MESQPTEICGVCVRLRWIEIDILYPIRIQMSNLSHAPHNPVGLISVSIIYGVLRTYHVFSGGVLALSKNLAYDKNSFAGLENIKNMRTLPLEWQLPMHNVN